MTIKGFNGYRHLFIAVSTHKCMYIKIYTWYYIHTYVYRYVLFICIFDILFFRLQITSCEIGLATTGDFVSFGTMLELANAHTHTPLDTYIHPYICTFLFTDA